MADVDVKLISPDRTWTWRTSQPSVVVAFPVSPENECPVALFLHGFVQMPTWYRTMLKSIARKGVIVVAVQLYTTLHGLLRIVNEQEEAKRAEVVIEWIFSEASDTTSLRGTINQQIPFHNSLTIVAHSRGAAALMNMVLRPTNANKPTLKALLLLDPVGSIDVLDQRPELPQEMVIFGCRNGVAPSQSSDVYWTKLSGAGYRPLFIELEHFGHLDFLDEGMKSVGNWFAGWFVSSDRNENRRISSRNKISELIGIYVTAVCTGGTAEGASSKVRTELDPFEDTLGMRVREFLASPARSSNQLDGLQPAI
eukprot:CAMPEP_0184745484 /NCGR_PEP_ID=MMETSP0315-20130426/8148_1 /TAXON_ID=101924 /ORGANISM="Rhodosorus marinus, Strain UTEX LB 2760" /LENGTH=309 /DNA_ID=CAMNT_0027217651 /DNA_START=134 /DNA_END=1063 /DNA_ORIENTATION=-